MKVNWCPFHLLKSTPAYLHATSCFCSYSVFGISFNWFSDSNSCSDVSCICVCVRHVFDTRTPLLWKTCWSGFDFLFCMVLELDFQIMRIKHIWHVDGQLYKNFQWRMDVKFIMPWYFILNYIENHI